MDTKFDFKGAASPSGGSTKSSAKQEGVNSGTGSGHHGVQDGGNEKRPLIYYAICAAIILMLVNMLFVPFVQEVSIQEVPYNDFISMLDDDKITQVSIDESAGQITFSAENDQGGLTIYKTGVFPNDTLIDKLEQHDVTFGASIPTQSSPLLSFLLMWIVPTLIFFGIGVVINKKLSANGKNVMNFGKSKPKIVADTDIKTRFSDVAGQDEAKEALQEIVDLLHNPQKYTEIGAKIPKGALLVGPPGTGKTLIARAVAGEAGVPFFSMSGSEFVEMFVGMGAAKMRDLFEQANKKAPCIVFIDEIDAIGKKRDGQGRTGNDEREQTLNQLLTEMDGFDSKTGVVIMAATNRPESLDPALLRPGRFDRRIPMQLPDLKGRQDILQVHAKSVKMAPGIDFEAIARATSGASGAELANIVNEAALRAVRVGHVRVEQVDLQESVEVVIAGHQRKNAVLTPNEKRMVAYHEVGHALVAARQSGSAPVTKITIIPRTSGALGYTMQVEDEERYLMTKEELEQRITTLTGGRAAEELIFGVSTTGASNDIEKATQLARSMVTTYGMTNEFGMFKLDQQTNQYLGAETTMNCSAEIANKADNLAISIVKQAKTRADNILAENIDKLHEISAYLIEKETITGQEFMQILNN
jgi:cell division protease FtsH